MASYATAPELGRYAIRSVDRAEVLRYLGYLGHDVAPGFDEELDARIDRVIARCVDVSQPAGMVRVFDIAAAGTADEPPVLAGTTLRLSGHDISAHLRGARAVALMSVTLGLANERELLRLSLTSPLDQAIFDAAGSALVERAADAAEARIIALAAERGLYANDRYAPGYGDLGLEVQPALLESLNAPKLLGVSLTPSNMLVPTKSETAILGLFDELQEHREDRLCNVCACREFCTIRTQGRTCRG